MAQLGLAGRANGQLAPFKYPNLRPADTSNSTIRSNMTTPDLQGPSRILASQPSSGGVELSFMGGIVRSTPSSSLCHLVGNDSVVTYCTTVSLIQERITGRGLRLQEPVLGDPHVAWVGLAPKGAFPTLALSSEAPIHITSSYAFQLRPAFHPFGQLLA